MNEPMVLMLRTVEQLGGRAVPIATLFAALPAAPVWVHRLYLDDLALMGLVVVRGGTVYIARAPGIVCGAPAG